VVTPSKKQGARRDSRARSKSYGQYACSEHVDLYELPPPAPGDATLNKSCIWVEEQDFYCDSNRKKSNGKTAKAGKQVSASKSGKTAKAGKRAGARTRGKSTAPTLIIGFDTEFKTPDTPVDLDGLHEGKAKYEVLSYQFHCRTEDGIEWSGICCPDQKGAAGRITLGEFLVFALGKGVREGHVKLLPTNIYLVGHFTRADVPAFADFKTLTSLMSNVRNTFISIENYLPVTIKFPNRKTVELHVALRDTMLLAPAGAKSLAALGDIVGRPKLKLDSDPARERWLKKNMDHLRATNWPLFKEYAINDAVVCVEYAEKIRAQYHAVSGKKKIPATLTSIGVDLLLKTWQDKLERNHVDVLGREVVVEKWWNDRKQRYIPQKREVNLEEVNWHVGFVTETYHGGRNEQFWFGPAFEGVWTDYDLSSAYPTAMAMIGLPDWRKIAVASDPELFSPTTLGFACVDFEFPESVRYPTLPVRTSNGLVFPSSGRSCCAAPEIALARQLGAKLKIDYGVIVPTNNATSIFGEFIRDCLDKRAAAANASGKKSLDALFWKEISNSTYGKTAQGLRQKRVYDMRERNTQPLPESRITNAFFASYITSFVRAVLGEIINGLPDDVLVFSCTTDGFLANATAEQIAKAQSGPFAVLFREARKKLTGTPGVLEIKHQIAQPLGWRTRGQATLKAGPLNPTDSGHHIVLAKAGIFTAQELDTVELQNDEIVRMFFGRWPEQKIHVAAKTGIRDMVEYDADLVEKDIEKRLNMEFDWKRRPIASGDSATHGHLVFSTAPWASVDQFKRVRELWQDFLRRSPACLKTEDDYRVRRQMLWDDLRLG